MKTFCINVNGLDEMKIVEGYAASLCFKKINWSSIGIPCLINFSEVNMTYSDFECCDEDIVSEKITIEQLNDMVVLKRNDVGDANFIRPRDGKLYFKSSENRYYHMLDDDWIMSTWENEQLEPQLKPISEKPHNETEYLLQGKNGDYLMDGVGQIEDNVNHPSHYAGGGIECIDAMIAAYGIEAVKQYCKLNAFKYQWRFDKKNGNEDILKCQWYQNKYMELSNEL